MGSQQSSSFSDFSEKASQASKKASEKASQASEKASEKASQASEEASEKASQASEKASEKASQATRNVSEHVSDASDHISKKIDSISESLKGDSFSSTSSSGILTGVDLPRHNDSVDAWRATIRQKLLKEQEIHPNHLNEILDRFRFGLEDLITVLGDPDAFQTAFLRPKYNFTAVRRELSEEIEAYSQLGFTADDIEAALQRMQERRRRAQDLDVKLILTSCAVSSNVWIRRITRIVGYDFGALHAGLLVDGTLLEWGRGKCGSSIVYPSLDLSGFLIAVDIRNRSFWHVFRTMMWNAVNFVSFGLANILYGAVALWILGTVNAQQLTRIAVICTNFNRYKVYSPFETNCQTFVKAVCDKLSLSSEFQGEMKNFVQRLIRDGKSDFIFRDQTFGTRQELDNYAMNHIRFRRLITDDQKLLLGYAHVFDEYRSSQPLEERWKSTENARQFWIDTLEWMQWGDRR